MDVADARYYKRQLGVGGSGGGGGKEGIALLVYTTISTAWNGEDTCFGPELVQPTCARQPLEHVKGVYLLEAAHGGVRYVVYRYFSCSSNETLRGGKRSPMFVVVDRSTREHEVYYSRITSAAATLRDRG